jgi:hypothetical protein
MRQSGNRCRSKCRSKCRNRHRLAPLAVAVLLMALCVQRAHAEHAAQRIVIAADGGAHRIGVHPAYVTVLDFASPIVRVVRSDATHFTIEATDRRVFLRPLEETRPGTVANLHVVTEQSLVTVLLHVTEQPADAATHVTFTDRPAERRVREAGRKLALAAGGVLGSISIDDGNRLFVGGLEAGLVHPRSSSRSVVALAAVTRAWYAPVDTAPATRLLPDVDSKAMATVQTVRVLGGYRVHRGQRLRAHATLLAGMQRWWLHESQRLLDTPGTSPSLAVESRRSSSHTDGVTGMDLGLGITLWPRWHAGLGIRAIRAWGIDAPAYDSIEGWLSLQWL